MCYQCYDGGCAYCSSFGMSEKELSTRISIPKSSKLDYGEPMQMTKQENDIKYD